MMIMTNTINGKFQGQSNIVSGFKGIEGEYTPTKAGLYSEVKRQETGKTKLVSGSNKSRDILCRHVLTGRVKAHKICCKNFECFHCAYDQMLDDQDIDGVVEKPLN